MPLMVSSQPHANQTNIHLKFLNSLTPHTPMTDTTLTQDTPCPISSTAKKMDLPIEKTLYSLSLFQKPIKLFSTKQSPAVVTQIIN